LKVKSNKDIESLELSILLKIEGVIVEYKEMRDLSNAEENKKLEKEISKHIKKKWKNY
jgi:hypothetical protein